MRRAYRDRYDASMQTTKKCSDEIKARWIKQKDSFAGGAQLLDFARDCDATLIQFGVRQRSGFIVTVRQKSISDFLRAGHSQFGKKHHYRGLVHLPVRWFLRV